MRSGQEEGPGRVKEVMSQRLRSCCTQCPGADTAVHITSAPGLCCLQLYGGDDALTRWCPPGIPAGAPVLPAGASRGQRSAGAGAAAGCSPPCCAAAGGWQHQRPAQHIHRVEQQRAARCHPGAACCWSSSLAPHLPIGCLPCAVPVACCIHIHPKLQRPRLFLPLLEPVDDGREAAHALEQRHAPGRRPEHSRLLLPVRAEERQTGLQAVGKRGVRRLRKRLRG